MTGVQLSKPLALDMRKWVRLLNAGEASPEFGQAQWPPGTRLLLGKVVDEIAPNAWGRVTIHAGDAPTDKGAEPASGDREHYAYNRLLPTLSEGDWVIVARIAGTGWEILQTVASQNSAGTIAGGQCGCDSRLPQWLGIEHGCSAIAGGYSAARQFGFQLPTLKHPGLAALSAKAVVLKHATGCVWEEDDDEASSVTCQEGDPEVEDVEAVKFVMTLLPHSAGGETLHPKALLKLTVLDGGDAGVSCDFRAVAYCDSFDPLAGGVFRWQPGNCVQVAGCFCVRPMTTTKNVSEWGPCWDSWNFRPDNAVLQIVNAPTSMSYAGGTYTGCDNTNIGNGSGVTPIEDVNGTWVLPGRIDTFFDANVIQYVGIVGKVLSHYFYVSGLTPPGTCTIIDGELPQTASVQIFTTCFSMDGSVSVSMELYVHTGTTIHYSGTIPNLAAFEEGDEVELAITSISNNAGWAPLPDTATNRALWPTIAIRFYGTLPDSVDDPEEESLQPCAGAAADDCGNWEWIDCPTLATTAECIWDAERMEWDIITNLGLGTGPPCSVSCLCPSEPPTGSDTQVPGDNCSSGITGGVWIPLDNADNTSGPPDRDGTYDGETAPGICL